MVRITSSDRTDIATWIAGAGPPLVLVHGTAADHTRWESVSSALEGRFTVYAVDRRGRGESGDADPYSIEREYEDIAAVCSAIHEPVHLLGHSYGALCSLGAALLTKNLAKLILYEPPVPTGVAIYPPGAAERIQRLVDSGDRDGAVSTFLREIVRMPDHELTLQRSTPAWRARVAAAHTIPREMGFGDQHRFMPKRFQGLVVPTLLLLGGESPPFFKSAIDDVHKAIRNSHVAVLQGQQHTAMETAPELFVGEVLKFLLQ